MFKLSSLLQKLSKVVNKRRFVGVFAGEVGKSFEMCWNKIKNSPQKYTPFAK